jgi:hypothetical protein
MAPAEAEPAPLSEVPVKAPLFSHPFFAEMEQKEQKHPFELMKWARKAQI